MNCRNCGTAFMDGMQACPACGTPVNSYANAGNGGGQNYNNAAGWGGGGMVICPQCGNMASPNDVYCSKCGASIRMIRGRGNNSANTIMIVFIAIGAALLLGAIAFLVSFLITGRGTEPATTPAPVATSAAVVQTQAPAPPVFLNLTASSVRGVDYTGGYAVNYFVEYAMDGNMSTCWSPNRNLGLNPTLTMSAPTPQHVTGIRLTNGYCKSYETYAYNRRISRAEIIYEGGNKIVTFPDDAFGVMHNIVFDNPVDTSYIQIHVLDTYYGKWKDICISEIEVY
ncbi:MAG: zinc ribbon domain-containing protein [Oscillospiraceae bacterium]|nr:zinc ribbon domain-containing protein [Oscillospiraceae bacterium]